MRDTLIWTIVTLIIVGTTVALFITFAPANAGYSYWVAMSDVSLVEVIVGAFFAYYYSIGAKKHKTTFPIAMNIGIFSTFIIFSSIGVVVDIVLAAIRIPDFVLLWLIIGRWVLLLAVLTPMWFTGKAGIGSQKKSDLSRKRRGGVLSTLEQALANLRNLTIDTNEQASWRKVIDEVETIRNKIRSRASDPAIDDSKEDLLENLVFDLVSITNSPDLTPAEAVEQAKIMARKIASELY